jgi:hypothetical protein
MFQFLLEILFETGFTLINIQGAGSHAGRHEKHELLMCDFNRKKYYWKNINEMFQYQISRKNNSDVRGMLGTDRKML